MLCIWLTSLRLCRDFFEGGGGWKALRSSQPPALQSLQGRLTKIFHLKSDKKCEKSFSYSFMVFVRLLISVAYHHRECFVAISIELQLFVVVVVPNDQSEDLDNVETILQHKKNSTKRLKRVNIVVYRLSFWFFGHPTCPRLPGELITGNITAEVFSMSKSSAWRLLMETATSIQGDDDDRIKTLKMRYDRKNEDF